MKKKNIITIVAGLIVVIVLAVVFLRGDQLEHLVQDIKRGSPLFLILALLSQMTKYVFQGFSFAWCFKAAGAHLPIKENILLIFQTFFMDTIIPSMNISGTSTVIAVATKRGVEGGRATSAALLRQVSITASFVFIMLVGFVILMFIGKFEIGWLIVGSGAIGTVFLLVGGMALAAYKPHLVLKICKPFEHLIDKILAHFHKGPIDNTIEHFVMTYAESAKGMMHHKGDIAMEMLFAIIANIFEVFCFMLVGFAFSVTDVRTLICVYVIASLAVIATPIPQGIGVVEGAAVVAFSLFGYEQAEGVAIIMVYRVAALWIPFILGAFFMRGVEVDVDENGKLKKNASSKEKGSALPVSKEDKEPAKDVDAKEKKEEENEKDPPS